MPRKVNLSVEEIRMKQDKYNKSISSSIAGILRLSLNTEFRLKCYDLMKVDNTNDLEIAIKRKLDIQSKVIQNEECLVKDASTSHLEMCNTAKEIDSAEVEDMPYEEVSNDKLLSAGNDLQETSRNIRKEDDMEEDDGVWSDDECFQWSSERNRPGTSVGGEIDKETREEAADGLLLNDVLWN